MRRSTVLVLVQWAVLGCVTPLLQLGSAATLVGYWPFDEGDGATAADVALGNPGTLYGAAWSASFKGHALRFDGESAFVQIPNAAQYNSTEAVSVEAWVAMTEWQSCQQPNVFDKSHRGPDLPPYSTGYVIQGANATAMGLDFAVCGPQVGCAEIDSQVPMNDGQWHFVAGTVSSADGVIRFYLDGELAMESPFQGPIGINDGDIYIGRHFLLGRYYSGLIDEVKVFEGALSSEEVWSDFAADASSIAGPGAFVRSRLEVRPNPFTTVATIQCQALDSEGTSIVIVDAGGRIIRRLVGGRAAAGKRSLLWDGRSDDGRAVPAGVYLLRLAGERGVETSRLVVVR